MSREDPQMKIRLPEDLKVKIEKAAAQENRTLNSEIVHRLAESFDRVDALMDVSAKLRDGAASMDELTKRITGLQAAALEAQNARLLATVVLGRLGKILDLRALEKTDPEVAAMLRKLQAQEDAMLRGGAAEDLGDIGKRIDTIGADIDNSIDRLSETATPKPRTRRSVNDRRKKP